jgi:hypothetical protein
MPRPLMMPMAYPLSVMAGLDPAIHAFPPCRNDGDARIESGHDDFLEER